MAGVKARRCPEGYGAKSLRILRAAKDRGMHLREDGRVVLQTGKLHSSTPQWGRNRIGLSIDGERIIVQTARAVCFLAYGDPPAPSSVVDHIDGNTENDHPANLRWATYSENTRNSVYNRQKTWEQLAVEACRGMLDPPAHIAWLEAELGKVAPVVEAARRAVKIAGAHGDTGWFIARDLESALGDMDRAHEAAGTGER